jgi:1,4-dihydroxy-2-naphthoate octaprenyltransferase
MKNWWAAFRPRTLTAAAIPVVTASALAYLLTGVQQLGLTALALGGALAIQISTNLFNDVLDFKKGADGSARKGPVRQTAAGLISPEAMYRAALLFLMIAAACGIPLVMIGGWPIVVIGLVSMFLAYAYTGGPLPLAYVGLGDLFVVLFFGVIAVMGTYFVLTLQWSGDALVLGLQIGLLAAVLIAINNARDAEEDAKVGKMTLAARFGLAFTRWQILIFYSLAFGLNLYWWQRGLHLPALLSVLALPHAVYVVIWLWRHEPDETYNRLLARSAASHFFFGFGFMLGCFL